MRIIRRIVQGIIKIIFLLVQKIQGKCRFINTGIVVPDEPVLFLSNHQLNFDAVRLRAHNNRRIAYVVHEEIYRNKAYKWIATNLMDMICRGSSKTDVSYIKDLFRAKKKGLSIGIYPEGGINYFNASIPFDISLAKLCKKLNMPIVIVNVNGGSFIKPRWAKYKGHNKVEYKYKLLITKNELINYSLDELYQVLQTNLYVNDYDWQRKKLYKVNRKCPTLNLGKALFVCPDCNNLHSLTFFDNKICCHNCKSVFGLDQYDFVTGSKTISDLVEWDNLQNNILPKTLETTPLNTILLKATAFFSQTTLNKYFKNKDKMTAKIILTKDKVTISGDNFSTSFPTKDLYKIYVEFTNTLQFNYNDHKIRIEGESFPAYVWTTYLRCLTQSNTN